MELPPEKEISHKASTMAHHRMLNGTSLLERKIDYSPEARATLIAAYMNASAQYEIALYLRELCEGIDGLHAELQSKSNSGE